MSCQIDIAGNIADIGAIRRCLFPTDDSRGSDSWLQLCELSVSPTGDIIAIANERRLVILSSKWDPNSSINQFHITYSGSVHESDNIRAVACVPIVSQTKTSHVVLDWTCVLLGFESGFVRFYTENCELVLEEQLHNEVVSHIKCRSQHNPRPDIAPNLHPEEIYVQYQSTVCVLQGGQLFPLLRTFRAEFARVQAKGEPLELSHGNLNPKKWGFQDQATINDIAVVGVNLHGNFDHLLTASTYGGFETKYRSSAPYNNLVLAAGSRPFVGYHYALEGGPQPVFSDVAKAVASKLKSALPGWLTGGKAPSESKMTVAMQPSENMGCRFGLCDLRRTALNIVLSPDHKLAAVSDALGRVLLIDAYRGIALRIFKGYREAQCSFIQVPDERHSKHRFGNKVALFLVIYSPKKGTLEIFTVQKGTKITTFTASKFSRLVYNNYGLMGFTGTSKSKFVCLFDTLLIDNDGKIKEISIPFHFSLSEKNNKKARDIHLLKKLKQFLKHADCDNISLQDEICNKICPELKTPEIKLQTLELLLSDKNVPAEITLKCVQIFTEDESSLDNEDLKIKLENSSVLLKFFLFTESLNLDSKNGNSDSKSDLLETSINLNSRQLNNLQRLLDLTTLKNDAEKHKVVFVESTDFPVSEFISLFNLKTGGLIKLKENPDDLLLFKVGKQIFEKFVIGKNTSLDLLKENVSKTTIEVSEIFVLLLNYWINRPLVALIVNLEQEMSNLLSLIRTLTSLLDESELTSDDSNSPAKFWSEIREILADSSKPFPALTAAILCKSVSQSHEMSDSLVEDFETLEVLSQDQVEWGLLIGKLEDVSLLNIILDNKPLSTSCKLPKLKHERVDVSLKYILEKGRGSVSELVARWLTTSGVDPENIVINDKLLLKKSLGDDTESSDSDSDDDDVLPEQDIMPHKIEEVTSDPVFEQLNIIKSQFPYSSEAGVILTNMCWEYALAWQKDIQELNNLEACIKCLDCIPNCHVREGLSNLVWNTHLKIIFEAAAKLINKVGKLPKERLCRQDTGLSDHQIGVFLRITTNFLDRYMDALQESHGEEKPLMMFEPIWESGPRSLVELSLGQNSINYDLLHLHYQLSLVLQMITALSIKHSKPVNTLFESYMSPLFFKDFQSKAQINWDYADSRVQTSRTQFLFKAISSSLETVTVNDSRIYAADHLRWMRKFIDIGKLWNLDVDSLRRYELVQIYVNGFDSYGDEIFAGVDDKKKLGLELLEVAAKRLSQFLATSPHLAQNMAVLTTSVTRYMEHLNRDWCAPSSLDGIVNLANRSLLCIDDKEYEYKVAEMLLDGSQTLQSLYKSN